MGQKETGITSYDEYAGEIPRDRQENPEPRMPLKPLKLLDVYHELPFPDGTHVGKDEVVFEYRRPKKQHPPQPEKPESLPINPHMPGVHYRVKEGKFVIPDTMSSQEAHEQIREMPWDLNPNGPHAPISGPLPESQTMPSPEWDVVRKPRQTHKQEEIPSHIDDPVRAGLAALEELDQRAAITAGLPIPTSERVTAATIFTRVDSNITIGRVGNHTFTQRRGF